MFCRKYANIENTDQRQRYKQEFNIEYEEYKQLHYYVEKVCKKFNQFEVLLKRTPKHTQAFEVWFKYNQHLQVLICSVRKPAIYM